MLDHDRSSIPHRWAVGLTALLLLGVVNPGARAQCLEQRIPWSAEAAAGFGASVAATHDLVVAGAPEHTQPGLGPAGHVTVSRLVAGSWVSTSLPLPTLLGAGDRFGHAVAVNEPGDVVVVGAPLNDTNALDAGLVVVYRDLGQPQGWTVVAEWPGLFALGAFGFDVDVSGDVIVGGEPGGFGGVGAVGVFRRTAPSTWGLETVLTGVNVLDGFGWAVAVSFDRLIVGVPFRDYQTSQDSGRVDFYQYVGGAWTHPVAVVSPNANDHFGASVDVDGVDAVVGSPDEDASGAVDAGAVYYYHWSGSVSPSHAYTHGGSNQHLGTAVAVHAGWGVASSPFADGAVGTPFGAEGGQVSFARWTGSTWTDQPARLVTATDVSAGDHFGSAVALGPGRLAVGAPLEDTDGLNAGTTYVYDLGAHGVIGDVGFGLAGTGGLVPTLAIDGVLCGQTTVAVRIADVKPSAFVFLVVGGSGLYAPFRGGTMVPNPDILAPLTFASSSGELGFELFWPPGTPVVNIWVQAWIDDAGGVEGLSATNGVVLSSITP